jgi:hypothetical protein
MAVRTTWLQGKVLCSAASHVIAESGITYPPARSTVPHFPVDGTTKG